MEGYCYLVELIGSQTLRVASREDSPEEFSKAEFERLNENWFIIQNSSRWKENIRLRPSLLLKSNLKAMKGYRAKQFWETQEPLPEPLTEWNKKREPLSRLPECLRFEASD